MKTILLVDDEAPVRLLVRATLAGPHCRILEATNGTAALHLAHQASPDLLILDWRMPGLSGIEVAEALRQDPTTARIPIIMLTGQGDERDKARGSALGVYAYLVKPFSPLELLGKVQEVLGASMMT